MNEFIGEKYLYSARRTPLEKLFVNAISGETPGIEKFFQTSALAGWRQGDTTEIVFDHPAAALVKDFVKTSCTGAKHLWEHEMNYSDWESGHPVAPTSVAGFDIFPAWAPPSENNSSSAGKQIIIDPALAFGTGLHPTTRDTLDMMRTAFEEFGATQVVDIGCGSGILSVAAIMLGAQHSTAVDIALPAVESTKENARINNVDKKIEVHHDTIFNHTHHEADLVLCNINFSIAEGLLSGYEMGERKIIILSGVNSDSANKQAKKVLARPGRKIIRHAESSNWHTYLSVKK